MIMTISVVYKDMRMLACLSPRLKYHKHSRHDQDDYPSYDDDDRDGGNDAEITTPYDEHNLLWKSCIMRKSSDRLLLTPVTRGSLPLDLRGCLAMIRLKCETCVLVPHGCGETQ